MKILISASILLLAIGCNPKKAPISIDMRNQTIQLKSDVLCIQNILFHSESNTLVYHIEAHPGDCMRYTSLTASNEKVKTVGNFQDILDMDTSYLSVWVFDPETEAKLTYEFQFIPSVLKDSVILLNPMRI